VSTVGDGKHLRFRVKDGARDAGSAIAFGFGRQLDRLRQEVSYDVAFRLEENRWNGTVAPQLVVKRVFDAEPRYRELREWLGRLWREGPKAWPPEAAAVFAELGVDRDEPARRHLLESATFCRLLDAPPALAKAA
jgi:RecJ OB domain